MALDFGGYRVPEMLTNAFDNAMARRTQEKQIAEDQKRWAEQMQQEKAKQDFFVKNATEQLGVTKMQAERMYEMEKIQQAAQQKQWNADNELAMRKQIADEKHQEKSLGIQSAGLKYAQWEHDRNVKAARVTDQTNAALRKISEFEDTQRTPYTGTRFEIKDGKVYATTPFLDYLRGQNATRKITAGPGLEDEAYQNIENALPLMQQNRMKNLIEKEIKFGFSSLPKGVTQEQFQPAMQQINRFYTAGLPSTASNPADLWQQTFNANGIPLGSQGGVAPNSLLGRMQKAWIGTPGTQSDVGKIKDWIF